jgi:predicted alpha/beta superfamily hydrolase
MDHRISFEKYDVRSIPIYLNTGVDDHRPVYLTGNFNNWQAADPLYAFKRVEYGRYFFEFSLSDLDFPIYYKYVKGDWGDEEVDIFGNPSEPRTFALDRKKIVDYVPRWRTDSLACRPGSLPKKYIIEEDFEIPQLGKRRRIWALLPSDYHQRKKSYPVLYLQDAQNLFDENAPFGNWGIDQKMGVLKEMGYGDLIIVAIEHGGKDRIKEYLPFETKQFGPGEGKKYARFLTSTLKPYVDNKFRVLSHRNNTGIGGSSMGGLISAFTGIMYPEIFSKWMIFSPSLWLSSEIFSRVIHYNNRLVTQVYLYGGKEESASMEPDLKLFSDILKRKSSGNKLIKYNLSIHPSAGHNEKFWGEEFPKAIKWLYFNQ